MNNIIHRYQQQGSQVRKVISAEKSPLLNASEQKEEVQSEEVSEKTTPDPISKDDTRTSKRAEFSALERSRKLEAQAKAKLQKAEELSSAYASQDLDAIAKANGMSTTDYVRWVNQKVMGIETKRDLTPAEQVAENAKKWQERIEGDVERLNTKVATADKYSYINKNIIPHLIKDPDKYEFIHDKGIDEQASDVYDFMNQHYIETGGKNGGEELNVLELLDGLEEQLQEEWVATKEKALKFKKLQTAGKVVEKQVDEDGMPVKTIGAAKSVSAPKSDADKLASMLAGDGADEDALAQSAPSNLVGGASRGVAKAVRSVGSFSTGSTPKNSKFDRQARLAAMAKARGE